MFGFDSSYSSTGKLLNLTIHSIISNWAKKNPNGIAIEVKRRYSRREKAIFKKLSKSQKLRAFFKHWTIKEAYSKAIGTGLTEPSKLFDISLITRKPDWIFNTEQYIKGFYRWDIMSFAPKTDYTATLVVEGHNLHFYNFQYGPKTLWTN